MKKLITIITLLILIISALYLWSNNGLKPVNLSDKSEKIFVVQKGEGVREIANELKKENLIKDPVVFFLLVKKLNLDGKIQAGDFRLSPSMSAEEIAKNLTHGMVDIWITIPEGKREEEVIETMQGKIPTVKPTWKKIFAKNEGYLFPDTYLIPRTADASLVMSLMTDNFEKKFSTIQNKTNFTKEELITLASLIERESKFPEDRPLVASVLMNRLKISMPLQIDATVQYALGFQEDENTWWKKDLTKQDLKIDSPYNTYVNVGFPPGPISNPGLDALEAAANPRKTNYLYYISDKKGHLHFAETLEGHNVNIKKFVL